METAEFVPPTLARGPGSYCALAGDVLDSPHRSPRIDGAAVFDEECARIAAALDLGHQASFRYGCLTSFRVTLTPKAAAESWPSYVQDHFVHATIKIGERGKERRYWHPLRDGGRWAYIAEKHRLKEHDARAIDYLFAAIGAAREGGDRG